MSVVSVHLGLPSLVRAIHIRDTHIYTSTTHTYDTHAYASLTQAVMATASWLLNPLSISMCTRGSAEPLVLCLILLILGAVLDRRPFLAGAITGVAVHMKLYPIIYVLPSWLYLSTRAPKPSSQLQSREPPLSSLVGFKSARATRMSSQWITEVLRCVENVRARIWSGESHAYIGAFLGALGCLTYVSFHRSDQPLVRVELRSTVTLAVCCCSRRWSTVNSTRILM